MYLNRNVESVFCQCGSWSAQYGKWFGQLAQLAVGWVKVDGNLSQGPDAFFLAGTSGRPSKSGQVSFFFIIVTVDII